MIDGPTLAAARRSPRACSVEEVFADPTADAERRRRSPRRPAPWSARWRRRCCARAVDTVTPHGLAAIAQRVEVPLDDAVAAAAGGPLALVLVDVADPGNAGTLLRAAEAAGAAAVLFCGSSVDPSNAKCVRASAGALFHLPVASGGDAVAVLERLRRARGAHGRPPCVRGGDPYDARRPHRPGGGGARQRGPRPARRPGRGASTRGSRSRWPDGSSRSTWPWPARSLCFESLRQRRAVRR